ncbi:hypothetical protein V8E54_006639 [Elaphomyces granulatus]
MSRRAPRPVPAVSPDPVVSPVPVVSPDPAVSPDPVVSRPCGRQAIATFPNNITNIDPATYMWAPLDVEPTRALLWLVGDIEAASLTNADSYDSWTVNIRLPAQTNTALSALLKSGPYKSYASPARYSNLRIKANLKKVLDQLKELEESGNSDRAVPAHGELITAYEPYPFAYDGSKLTADGPMPVPNEKYQNLNLFYVKLEVQRYANQSRPLQHASAAESVV